MKRSLYLVIFCILLPLNSELIAQTQKNDACTDKDPIVWKLSDFIKNTHAEATIEGNPEVVDSPFGKAVLFNGINDAILLDYSPLLHMPEFTVEVIMRPDTEGLAEQRFLHLGEATGERIMLETRLTDDGFWYVDGFVRSGEEYLVLIDSTKLHPLNEWYNVTMVNKKGQVEVFINGKSELSGSLPFRPFTTGQSSIGVRQNKVYWFKGAMYKLRITPEALSPEQLIKIKDL